MTEQEIKWLFNTMRGINFFQQFNLDTIDTLIKKIEKYSYPKGTRIIKEGEPGKAFYIIYKGKVKVWKKKTLFSKINLAELSGGNFFGEMSLVTDDPCSANVTAIEPVEVFVLLKETFRNILRSNPALLEEIKHIIEKRKFEQEIKK